MIKIGLTSPKNGRVIFSVIKSSTLQNNNEQFTRKGVEGESIWERVKNGQTVFHFHFFQPIYYLTLQSVSPGLPSFGTVCNDENRFDFPEDFLVLSNCRRFKIIMNNSQELYKLS